MHLGNGVQFYENCHKFEIMVVSLALFFEEMELMQSGPASDSSQDCPPTAGCTTLYSHHTKPVQAHFCGDLKGFEARRQGGSYQYSEYVACPSQMPQTDNGWKVPQVSHNFPYKV